MAPYVYPFCENLQVVAIFPSMLQLLFVKFVCVCNYKPSQLIPSCTDAHAYSCTHAINQCCRTQPKTQRISRLATSAPAGHTSKHHNEGERLLHQICLCPFLLPPLLGMSVYLTVQPLQLSYFSGHGEV